MSLEISVAQTCTTSPQGSPCRRHPRFHPRAFVPLNEDEVVPDQPVEAAPKTIEEIADANGGLPITEQPPAAAPKPKGKKRKAKGTDVA